MIKIIMIHQVLMYCSLSMKIDTHGAGRSWMHFVYICFYMPGGQKAEYPHQFSISVVTLYICNAVNDNDRCLYSAIPELIIAL